MVEERIIGVAFEDESGAEPTLEVDGCAKSWLPGTTGSFNRRRSCSWAPSRPGRAAKVIRDDERR